MSGFRTKARAVDLLGEKQIKDEATAISELFKNAHDADATRAEIAIHTSTDTLVLWDDGHGMSLEDVENKWLTIGTDSKLMKPGADAKFSPKGRIMMGEKGIGRLAIATLGKQTVMITRRPGGPYVLVYIHWGLFSNGNLFLEDTRIPVKVVQDVDEFDRALEELKDEQLENIFGDRVQAAWADKYEALANEILRDVRLLRFDHAILDQHLGRIEASGTLFYVTRLKEDWRSLAHPGQKGLRLQRKRATLEVMMSSFINNISLFEGESVETHLEDVYSFKPRFLIDSREIIHPEAFTAEDMGRHDYALVGTVREGRFSGEALIHGAVADHVTDLDCTEGLDIADRVDCGPVKVHLYLVEGELDNTHLPEESWRIITDKLRKIGGIYIYRDGLRVLPYGTPEYDFLEIEKRRTIKAGRYMLSMRRIFGYIAISKMTNPRLEDKSSREGLRENPEYEFFRQVLMQLVVWWGKTYLDREGHREGAVEKLQQQREVELELHKRRQDRTVFLDLVRKQIEDARAKTAQQASAVIGEIETRIPTNNQLGRQVLIVGKGKAQNYFDLWALTDSLDAIKRELRQRISTVGEMALPFDPRFSEDPETMEAHGSFIRFRTEQREKLTSVLEARAQNALEYLNGHLRGYLEQVANQLSAGTPEAIIQGLREMVSRSSDSVTQRRSEQIRKLIGALENKAQRYRLQLKSLDHRVSNDHQKTTVEWTQHLVSTFAQTEAYGAEMRTLFDAFTSLDATVDRRAALSHLQVIAARIQHDLEEAEQNSDVLIQRAVAAFAIPPMDILDQTEGTDALEEERRFVRLLEAHVGELNAQIEEYRGLVATGIAAEVVNHEFEQQYELLNGLFDKPQIQKLLSANEDLASIRTLFKHIEERHRLLSPLYRRTRMYRKTLRLFDIAERIRQLFENQIELYNIDFRNDIDPDFYVYESEPILFPVFINILNNAVYWMLNRRDRRIRLRTDLGTGALYIEDSGSGVPPENVEKIFRLFYSTRLDGRGIGLHLVREVLESRNHRVNCVVEESEKSLPGACFRVTFDPSTIVSGGERE